MASIARIAGIKGSGRMLLAAALIFTLLLGATEAGRLVTGLRAIGALIGGVVIVTYVRRMPRESDIVDQLALAGFGLFLLTCVTSAAPRSSFDAATSAIAYLSAFYLARGVVAEEQGRQFAITTLGMIGAVIGLVFLFLWASIWLKWMTVGGGGLPPFDLALPASMFRHYYLLAMFAAMLLPATLQLARRPGVWPLGVVGSPALLLIAFMSGGRIIWLAGVLAMLVGVLTTRRLRLHLDRWPARIALLLGAAAIATLSASLVARIGATSTIELRFAIWQATLSRWLESPIVGFGPGSFAREFALTGYYNTYDTFISHAHNSAVQLLLESGLVGLLGLGLVCTGLLAGALRQGRLGWAPAAVFAFFAVASITDNPAIVPFLLITLIVWAAIACPRPTVDNFSAASRPIYLISLVAASIAGVATLSTLVAAWSYDRANDAATAGDTTQVIESISTSVALDPSFALYQRELGVWLMSVGDLRPARDHIAAARMLNPADTQSYLAGALLSAQEGDYEMAVELAASAVALEGTHVENLLTLAYVNSVFGRTDAERAALVEAVRQAPWLTAAPEWRAVFPDAEPQKVLFDAFASWQGKPDISVRNLRARAWLAGLTGADSPDDATLALQVEIAVLQCRIDVAAANLAAITGRSVSELESLQARLLFERAFGTGETGDVETLIKLRAPPLDALISYPSVGTSPVWNFGHDARFYDRRPIPPPIRPAFPTIASGLSAWLRDPLSAADRGAPQSGLAICR
jgi:exopolysaccharide production protein ExoQ